MTSPAVRALTVVPHPAGSPGHEHQPSGPPWPALDDSARHGVAGEVVNAIAPETEADPAALLVSLLVAAGSCIGAGPHVLADGARHPARLFAVLVGQSSKARKGTSWSQVRQVMEAADEQWLRKRVLSGLSSGEGLIKHAAEGGDHRILVQEPEFARVLTAASREKSTLSPVIRQAWDTGDLRVMTKEPIAADGAHISILAHITVEELRETLTGVQAANGFANRFLFACVKRGRLLPTGGKIDPAVTAQLGQKLAGLVGEARKLDQLIRSTAADRVWAERYYELAQDDPGGLLGGVVSRGEAQVLRLSLTYALLDGSRRIDPEHIAAAWAVWRYCRDSAAWLFAGRTGSGDADRIIQALRGFPDRLASRTELSEALGNRPYGSKLDAALDLLCSRGAISRVKQPTGGRPRETIVLLDGPR